jgi:large subunit ribosomal protein L15
MKLHTLKPAEGSVHTRKRIGRGAGSGLGGTSTRGHKGAKSRSGYSKKKGFEGGQMPLQRRIPKFGFKNPGRVAYKAVNLDAIQTLVDKIGGTDISTQTLVENGIVGKNDLVKILSRGELTAKVNITAHQFSSKAVEAIEKVGGSVTKISS